MTVRGICGAPAKPRCSSSGRQHRLVGPLHDALSLTPRKGEQRLSSELCWPHFFQPALWQRCYVCSALGCTSPSSSVNGREVSDPVTPAGEPCLPLSGVYSLVLRGHVFPQMCLIEPPRIPFASHRFPRRVCQASAFPRPITRPRQVRSQPGLDSSFKNLNFFGGRLEN